ncbi:MAG: hypothetical protein AAFZ17_14090 [Cyanobacteria bacterium J06650_10]
MFVYILGSVEQNIFKLGVAADPFKVLARMQSGNPYRLSIVSRICVRNKNNAALIEGLGRRDLKQYEGAGEWLIDVPAGLPEQFTDGHYLRSLSNRAGVKLLKQSELSTPIKHANLQRLSNAAKRQGLTFDDILNKVQQAYAHGVSIDEIMAE